MNRLSPSKSNRERNDEKVEEEEKVLQGTSSLPCLSS